jgi:hypothetical protein
MSSQVILEENMDSIGWLMLIVGGAKLLLSALFGGNILGSGGIIDGLAAIFVIIGIILITIHKFSTQKEIAAKETERASMLRNLEQGEDIDLIVKSLDSKNSFFAEKALNGLQTYQKKHPNDPRIALLLKSTSQKARIIASGALLDLSIAYKDKNSLRTVISVLEDARDYYSYTKERPWREYMGEELNEIIRKIVETGFMDISQPFFEETAHKSIFSVLGLLLIGKPGENEAMIRIALEKIRGNSSLLPYLFIVSDLLAQKCKPEESIPMLNSYLLTIPVKENEESKLRVAKSIKWILENREVSNQLLRSIKQIGNIVISDSPGGAGVDIAGNYSSSDPETLRLLEFLKLEPIEDEVIHPKKPKIPF